jgi:RecB family exonuclease
MAGMGQQQLGFDGMPVRLYPCTPSRLASWLSCPRRYRMSYLDRPGPPKGPPWAHNSLGATVHAALAAWWRLPPPRRTSEAAAELVGSYWLPDGYRDDEQAGRWRVRAEEMVTRYVRHLDPHDEPIGVERVVAARTERLALSGRVDRLDLRPADDGGQELVVVDYKTGRHLLQTDDARSSLALALYALAAERSLRRRCRKVELHHLPSGQVASWEHTDESLARHLRRAESLAEEARAADESFAQGLPAQRLDEIFPPQPGPQCGYCDFARHCPEGTGGSPPRPPWAALGEPEVVEAQAAQAELRVSPAAAPAVCGTSTSNHTDLP